MRIRSSLVAALTVIGLSIGSVAVPAIATAAPAPQPNPYMLTTNDGRASSAPGDYYTHDGVTYFVASTVQWGRAIFSVTADTSQAPKLVAHMEVPDSSGGQILNLHVNGNYLFFVANLPNSYGYNWTPFVVNLTTNALTNLDYLDYGLHGDYNITTSFVSFGTKVYFFSGNNVNGLGLFTFDTTDGSVSPEADVPAAIYSNGLANTADRANEWGTAPMQKLGTKIYFEMSNARIRAYDTVSQTWSDNLTVNSSIVTAGRLWGNFSYQGHDGLIFSNSTNGSYYNVRFYFLQADGTVTPIGNWIDADPGNASFINYNGMLIYLNTAWDNSAGDVYEISQADGSRTSISSTLFPGATTAFIRNMTIVDGQLVMVAHTSDVAKEYLYKWSGTGAASQIGTISGSGNWFYSFPSTLNDYVRNEPIGVVGNQILIGNYQDPKIGFAPYRVDLSGNSTLVAGLNSGKEGGFTDFQCSSSDANFDYLLGSGTSASILTVASEVAGKLKYQVYNLTGVSGACGFSRIGDDIYFVGQESSEGHFNGQDGAVYHLYKMSPDGTITHNGSFDAWARYGFNYAGYYYFMGQTYTPYGIHLYQVDPATGDIVRLTGDGTPGPTSVDNTQASTTNTFPLQVGNKIYFSGQDPDSGSNRPFIATLGDDGSVTVAKAGATAFGDSYGFMGDWSRFYNLDGRVIMVTGGRNDVYYEIDQTTDEISTYGDLNPRRSWYRENSTVSLDGVIYSIEDYDGQFTGVTTWDGTSGGTVDPGFEPTLLMRAGAYIIMADGNGNVAYFDGTNFTRRDGLFGPNQSQIDGGRVDSPRGIYFDEPQYAAWRYDNAPLAPWASQPVFLGNLVPQATARFGSPVAEAPASVYPAATPTFDLSLPNPPTSVKATSGAGVVNLSWTAPATGTVDFYSVESTPAGATCDVTGTTAVCSGLTTGTRYTFKVKSINVNGVSSASANSNQIAGPIVGDVPTITPEARVGVASNVVAGTWSSGTTLTYQWKVKGRAVSSTNSYTPASGDYGKAITVSVTGKRAGLPSVTMTSTAATVKSDVVAVSGTAKQGQKLVADQGNWASGTSLSYQWLRDRSAISGATANKYTVVGDDAGHRLSVAVTGTKAGNSETRTSAESASVPFKRFSLIGTPSIDKPVYLWDWICAYTTDWDAKAQLSYQWYKNGVLLDGETSDCYSVYDESEIGSTFSVIITGSRSGYQTVSTRPVKSKVEWRTFGTLDKPVVSGGNTVGSHLTVDLGNISWNWGWTNISYQWLRNGAPISGATNDNYDIQSADKMKRVVVRVTLQYPGYRSRTVVSTTTDLIRR
jgi:hypothetical protein